MPLFLSFVSGSRPSRPSSTIWSNNDISWVSPGAAPAEAAAFLASLLMGFSLFAPGLGNFRLQFVHIGGIAQGALQQVIELVVALQAAAKVRQFRPQIQKVVEGFNLFGDLGRFEILHAFEFQIDP